MRKVSIKQLYKRLSKELDDLPFAIIKRGQVVAVVQGLDIEQSLEKKGLYNTSKGLDKPVEKAVKSRPDSYFKPMPKTGKK